MHGGVASPTSATASSTRAKASPPPSRWSGSTTTCKAVDPSRAGKRNATPTRCPPTRDTTARPPLPAAMARRSGSGRAGWSSADAARANSSPTAVRSVSPRRARSTNSMPSGASTPANVTRYREQVAKPRSPKGRARLVIERLAVLYPGTAEGVVRARSREPVPAPRRDHPLGTVHRRTGQHGDPGPLRQVPRPGRAGRGQPGGRRGDHPLDRLLPCQDQEPHRHGLCRGREVRGRGAGEARGSGDPARRRAQDRQRGAER